LIVMLAPLGNETGQEINQHAHAKINTCTPATAAESPSAPIAVPMARANAATAIIVLIVFIV
jgi:hypothetical protein